jgi:hypothetical protein
MIIIIVFPFKIGVMLFSVCKSYCVALKRRHIGVTFVGGCGGVCVGGVVVGVVVGVGVP